MISKMFIDTRLHQQRRQVFYNAVYSTLLRVARKWNKKYDFAKVTKVLSRLNGLRKNVHDTGPSCVKRACILSKSLINMIDHLGQLIFWCAHRRYLNTNIS